MKKQQAVNLWEELHDTTDKQSVFTKLFNKPGYGGKRTLIRYGQVDEGLRQGESIEELIGRTGWSEPYLKKVCTWWIKEFEVGPAAISHQSETSAAEPSAVAGAEELARREKHHEMVLAPLTNLTGIEPFALQDPDLMNFYARPNIPYWPIPKGWIWRDADGHLTAHLRCEHDCQISCEDDPAWFCLCQHLEDEPLGKTIEESKRAIEDDLSDRLELLAFLQERADRPEAVGGTGLRLIPDMQRIGDGSQWGYGPYFLFTILHQGMYRGLKLPPAPKRREEFQLESPGTVQLGGHPVVQAADTAVADRAIEWLLRMQDEVVEWPETLAALESYRRALAGCRNIQRQMQRLRLEAGLPVGSRCEVFRDWSR